MTIKANRAENIRKLTGAEVAALAPKGGPVDHAIPAAAAAALQSFIDIDGAALGAFFGPRLALYRERSADAEGRLGVADELRLAAEAVATIDELRKRLELLPDTVRVRADEALWAKHGDRMWFDLQQQLDPLLREARQTLSVASKETEPFKGRSGAKSADARDGLVADTAAEVRRLLPAKRGAKRRAAEIVQALMQACAVPVPADFAEFQTLARKAGKN